MKGYKYELAVWITAEDEHEAEEKLLDALEPENEIIWWECVSVDSTSQSENKLTCRRQLQ